MSRRLGVKPGMGRAVWRGELCGLLFNEARVEVQAGEIVMLKQGLQELEVGRYALNTEF